MDALRVDTNALPINVQRVPSRSPSVGASEIQDSDDPFQVNPIGNEVIKPDIELPNTTDDTINNTNDTEDMDAGAKKRRSYAASILSMATLDSHPNTRRKLLSLIFNICIAILAIVLPHSLNAYNIISILIASQFASWLFGLSQELHTCERLHKIVIKVKKLDGWGNVSFPIHFEHDRYECVTSVSQMCGMRGTSSHTQFIKTLYVNCALIVAAIVFKWHELHSDADDPDSSNHDDIKFNLQFCSLMSALIMTCGIIMIALFEINKYDKWHQILHYVGCVLITMISPSLWFELNFNLFSIIVSALTILLWMVYIIFVINVSDTYQNNATKVHYVSKVAILLEIIAWIITSFAISAWVWFLDQL